MEKIIVDVDSLNQLLKKMDLLSCNVKKLIIEKEEKNKIFKKDELTMKESCDYIKMSDSWIRKRIKSGEIQARRSGERVLLLQRKDLDKLLIIKK